MAYKSSTQPLCLYCGRKIRKRTSTVMFGRKERSDRGGFYASERTEKPTSKADVARLVNQHVVAVKWHREGERWESQGLYEPHKKVDAGTPVFIEQASLWDGESYDDAFFCNGDHARSYGYTMAEAYVAEMHRLTLPAYRIAKGKGT